MFLFSQKEVIPRVQDTTPGRRNGETQNDTFKLEKKRIIIIFQALGVDAENSRICEKCRVLAANSRGGYGSFEGLRY